MSRWTGLKKGKKSFRETSQSYYLSTVVYLSRRDSPAQEGGVPNQNSVCAANARVLPMGAVAWSAWSLWFARFLRCLVPTSQPGALEFEVVAVRHQLTVLRRRLPGRPRLRLPDRVLWVWLPAVAGVPEDHAAGQTGNHGPMALSGLPPLLALARSIPPSRTTKITSRGSSADPADEYSSTANPLWGAPRILLPGPSNSGSYLLRMNQGGCFGRESCIDPSRRGGCLAACCRGL